MEDPKTGLVHSVNASYADKYYKKGYTLKPGSPTVSEAMKDPYHQKVAAANTKIRQDDAGWLDSKAGQRHPDGSVYMISPNGALSTVSKNYVQEYLNKGYSVGSQGIRDATPSSYGGGVGDQGGYVRDMMAAQREAQRRAIEQALSPEAYNRIFSQIMEQLNPLYEAQKQEIGESATEQRRLADVDAERRGLYNSGVGAVMQNQVSKAEQQAVAKVLAQLQAQATELTGQQQDRMLKGIGLQGDWTSSDMGTLLGLLNSDRDYELGSGRLALDKELGFGRLGLDKTKADRDYELGQGQLDLGKLNSDRDYELGIGKLGLERKRFEEEQRQFNESLAEKQRQFNKDYDFRERSFSESIRQWEGEMGLKWSDLNSRNKIAWMNAELAQMDMSMKKEQWLSQKEYNNAQMKREGLQDAISAHSYLEQLKASGASKDDALSAIKMYQGYNPDLYSDLKASVNGMWGAASPGSSGGSKKEGLLGQPNGYGLGGYADTLRKRHGY